MANTCWISKRKRRKTRNAKRWAAEHSKIFHLLKVRKASVFVPVGRSFPLKFPQDFCQHWPRQKVWNVFEKLEKGPQKIFELSEPRAPEGKKRMHISPKNKGSRTEDALVYPEQYLPRMRYFVCKGAFEDAFLSKGTVESLFFISF